MSCFRGNNVIVKEGVIIGENVVLEDDVYIDCHSIVRDNVTIKRGTTIGANCILGEYQSDFYVDREKKTYHPLEIGAESIVRSGTIIYGDNKIGSNLQTGHRATIREHSIIGNHVSIGTLSDIQGYCTIGNYVRLHSNVFVGQQSILEDFVWILPYVILTNDPTPPSKDILGVTIKSFAVIAAGSIILPGITVESDTLVAAGAVVTKDVIGKSVVGGNPAKVISDITKIKSHITGDNVYPWREFFKRGTPWEESDYNTWHRMMSKR